MLSTRSLAKIKKKELRAAKAAANKALATPASSPDAAGTEVPLEARVERRKSVRMVAPGDEQGCSCPSCSDIGSALCGFWATLLEKVANVRELVVEAWVAGGDQMLLFLLFAGATGYIIHYLANYLAQELNLELPSMPSVSEALLAFSERQPVLALTLNFGIAAAIGAGFFYLNTLAEFFRRVVTRIRHCRSPCSTYQPLDDSAAIIGMISADAHVPALEISAEQVSRRGRTRKGDIEEGGTPGTPGSHNSGSNSGCNSGCNSGMSTARSGYTSGSNTARSHAGSFEENFPRTQLLAELRRVMDRAEELEIKGRGKATGANLPPTVLEARAELKKLVVRRDELRALLNRVSAVAPTVKKGKRKHEKGLVTKLCQTALVQIMTRSANGIFSVGIYFADLISDVQVMVLLVISGNYAWAVMGGFLLVFQFFIVFLRVLPYVRDTFGAANHCRFLVFGFPLGLLGLDFLMFLEPFGLLVLPCFPDWMRQFIPAYKATRIIAEVLIESLPQAFLQSYIYVVVLRHHRLGTATPAEEAMLDYAAVLPISIVISTVAMLKLWIEVVNGARAAGLTIAAKAVQLWEVGAGLPLDALKKGTIVDWKCPYLLEGPEVQPLMDALRRNSSLVSLDLTRSGLTWTGPDASGRKLLEDMSQNASVLSSLQKMVISSDTQYQIPVGKLRKGGEGAVEALREVPLFQRTPTSGPRREEILFIGDLLRKSSDVTAAADANEEIARERVIAMRGAVRSGSLKRDAWENTLCQLLVDGYMRRGHLLGAISAEALREIGFSAEHLVEVGFALHELREGGFTVDGLRSAGYRAAELAGAGFGVALLKAGGFHARELKLVGFSPLELKAGGFVARQLKEAGLSAEELRSNYFSAEELREGTYTLHELRPLFTTTQLRLGGFPAREMREVGFTLKELKEGLFPPEDLRGAGYYCSEMRTAGFTTEELRVAGYSGSEMRIAGFSAMQMREAGFTCKKLRAAGYSAAEALEAGWSVEVLRAAAYGCDELREARRPAAELKAVGFTLRELLDGGYATSELQSIGYGAEELRAAGVRLAELAMAGATVAQLKAAGISVIGLKAEGMPLEELKSAGYKLSDLKAAGYTPSELHSVGYEASELMGVGITVHECRIAGYTSTELLTAGCTVGELKAAGFAAANLKKAGLTCEQLLAGDFVVRELKDGGFSASELKSADVSANDMRFSCDELYAGGEGYSPIDLKSVGFTAKALRQVGVRLEQLVSASYLAQDLTDASYKMADLRPLYSVKQIYALNYSLEDLKRGGCSARSLRAAGAFQTRDLVRVGFSFDDLRNAGCTAAELQTVGATIRQLRQIGCAASELLHLGTSIDELRKGGVTAGELRESKVAAMALKEGGYDAQQLKDGGFGVMDIRNCGLNASAVFSVQQLKLGGYPAKALLDEGFSIKNLKDHYPLKLLKDHCTLQDLQDAGYMTPALKAGGFSAAEFNKVQTPTAELKEAGFSPTELREGKYKAKQLLDVGFTVAGVPAKTLRLATGVSVNGLLEVGFTVSELRSGGCTAEELAETGCGAKELYEGGFRVKQLRETGFTAMQLREAGMSVRELREAGRFGVVELHNLGIGADELRDGGFPLKQLKEVLGLGAVALRDAGFAAKDLEEVGFTAKQLRSCGYSMEEMAACGFDAADLRDAGFTAAELRVHWKMTAKELKDGGYAL